MSFSERQKAIALAIVHCFETSKAFGSPDTVAVLSDGAGFSVGISQFTHKSGSLRKVVSRYLQLGGTVAADTLKELRDDLMDASAANIGSVSRNARYRKALQDAGKTAIMRTAQEQIAFENYLGPAIAAGEGSNFKTTMALACIYDAKNQGGFDVCRDRTSAERKNFNDANSFERAWVKEFCMERRSWLAGSGKPIVRGTVYRPDFFLGEIAKGNWDLEPPLNVHGVKLNKSMFSAASQADGGSIVEQSGQSSAGTPAEQPPPAAVVSVPAVSATPSEPEPPPTSETALEKIGNKANAAYTAFGTMVAGVIAWFSTTSGTVVLALAGAAALLGVTYMIINWRRQEAKGRRDEQDRKDAAAREQELKILREKHAQEVQLYSMRSVAEDGLTAVTVAMPPPATELPNSDAPAGEV